MKTVICLIPFSDGVLSMYKGQIASIDETKAESLITAGYVAEYSAGGIGALVVNEDSETNTFDKTYAEIAAAVENGTPVIVTDGYSQKIILRKNHFRDNYDVITLGIGTGSMIGTYEVELKTYTTDAEDGYPVLQVADSGGGIDLH